MAIGQEAAAERASDGQLLRRFAQARDESAFEDLVRRHGPMVLRVCRSALHDPNDAQDAFQATFLTLVMHAKSIRRGDSVGPWLYGVACRVSARWRADAARRRARDLRGAREAEAVTDAEAPADWWALHEELDRLPEKYRAPLVLCYLEGLTHERAADRLQWPVGTVRGRLFRARELLKGRLVRRGLVPTAALLAMASAPLDASAALPAALAKATAAMAARFAMTGAVPSSLALLTTIEVKSGLAAKGKALAVALGVGGLAAGLLAAAYAMTLLPGGPRIDGTSPAGGPIMTTAVAPTVPTTPLVATIPENVSPIWERPRAVAFSPDGEVVAAAGTSGRIEIWEADSGEQRALLHARPAALRSIAFSPDGRRLASVDEEWNLIVWDLDREGWLPEQNRVSLTVEAMRTHLQTPAPVAGVAFAPDGHSLAVAGGGWLVGTTRSVVEVFDAATGEPRWTREGRGEWPSALAYAPDGKTLAIGGPSGVKLLDAATGEPTGTLGDSGLATVAEAGAGETREVTGSIGALAYAPDGKTLAAGYSGRLRNQLILWDVTSGEVRHRLEGPGGQVRTVAFSPDGKAVAIGGASPERLSQDMMVGRRLLYEAESGGLIWDLRRGIGDVHGLAFSPDGKAMVACDDLHVELIDVETGQMSRTLGLAVPPGFSVAPGPPIPSGRVMPGADPEP